MPDHARRARIRAERQAVIDRAIAHMDATAVDDLAQLLAQTDAKQAFKRDPTLLRNALAVVAPDDVGPFFNAFKIAEQILHAAGLHEYLRYTKE
jgi:hypothetical protein